MEWQQAQTTAPPALALATVRAWTLWLTEVERGRMPHLTRREARRRAWASSRGWLRPVERKNGWQWAEAKGETPPYGGQPGLGRAGWDTEAVRDDVRADLGEPRGEPQAIVGLDETGCRKNGPPSAGVARQESGTAGRLEHGPLGGCRASASRKGHAWLDCARSLPPAWTSDNERCGRAGGPEKPPCAPPPPLVRQWLQRAVEARVPAAWVTGARV
jgi:SRSO17 transposase